MPASSTAQSAPRWMWNQADASTFTSLAEQLRRMAKRWPPETPLRLIDSSSLRLSEGADAEVLAFDVAGEHH